MQLDGGMQRSPLKAVDEAPMSQTNVIQTINTYEQGYLSFGTVWWDQEAPMNRTTVGPARVSGYGALCDKARERPTEGSSTACWTNRWFAVRTAAAVCASRP